jgi:hypothetical protein
MLLSRLPSTHLEEGFSTGLQAAPMLTFEVPVVQYFVVVSSISTG